MVDGPPYPWGLGAGKGGLELAAVEGTPAAVSTIEYCPCCTDDKMHPTKVRDIFVNDIYSWKV